MAHRQASDQRLFGTEDAIIIVRASFVIVWLFRSACPFCWGVCGQLVTNSAPMAERADLTKFFSPVAEECFYLDAVLVVEPSQKINDIFRLLVLGFEKVNFVEFRELIMKVHEKPFTGESRLHGTTEVCRNDLTHRFRRAGSWLRMVTDSIKFPLQA